MAQGVSLPLAIGYTDGPLLGWPGAHGLLGIKLDYSSDRSGTGLLSAAQSDNRALRTNPVSWA